MKKIILMMTLLVVTFVIGCSAEKDEKEPLTLKDRVGTYEAEYGDKVVAGDRLGRLIFKIKGDFTGTIESSNKDNELSTPATTKTSIGVETSEATTFEVQINGVSGDHNITFPSTTDTSKMVFTSGGSSFGNGEKYTLTKQ